MPFKLTSFLPFFQSPLFLLLFLFLSLSLLSRFSYLYLPISVVIALSFPVIFLSSSSYFYFCLRFSSRLIIIYFPGSRSPPFPMVLSPFFSLLPYCYRHLMLIIPYFFSHCSHFSFIIFLISPSLPPSRFCISKPRYFFFIFYPPISLIISLFPSFSHRLSTPTLPLSYAHTH